MPLLVILIAPGIYMGYPFLLILVAQSDVLLSIFTVVLSWSTAQYFDYSRPVVMLLAVLAGIWYMLFRSRLFQSLESGTRRQRAFRSKLR